MRVPVGELVDGVAAGDRTALARAITLVESRRDDDRDDATRLLDDLHRRGGRSERPSHRVGITGVPGAGKSTLLDQLGTRLTGEGHRVAVLAVDPTSTRTGGSILGDKTRMERLAVDPNAFIRPSPTSGTLGGVARTTRETVLLCEAAGFDVVLVETVGVGQSEVTVADMVDTFVVIMLAGGGDQLQGIKKGVLELADVIAVNKAEGDNEIPARAAAREYQNALHLVTPVDPQWPIPVQVCSALHDVGLDELWDTVVQHRRLLERSGRFDDQRAEQAVRWFRDAVDDGVRRRFRADPTVEARWGELETAVRAGERVPTSAARDLLERVRPG